MGGKSQTNDQALVAKDLLFIAEDWIGKLRMEGRKSIGFGLARLQDGDVDCIIGIAGP